MKCWMNEYMSANDVPQALGLDMSKEVGDCQS